MNKQLKGAITALVTPFDEQGNVDIASLRKLVRFQIDSGIDAIVPCGSTGEAATLNDGEYELVIKTVVAENDGRVPIIAGAGSNDTQKAIYLSELAKKAGADMLLHATPYYNKPPSAGIQAHFKAIADAVDIPILLYNVPARTGSNVSAETTVHVAKTIPQVIGIKEASGNMMQMMDIIQNAPDNFAVLSGDDALTLPLLALGGKGCISVIANEIPYEFTTLIHAGLAGDWEKAKKLHYLYLDLMNVNFLETNPLPVKTALALMGKITESFRLPLVPMSEKNKQTLTYILQKHKLI